MSADDVNDEPEDEVDEATEEPATEVGSALARTERPESRVLGNLAPKPLAPVDTSQPIRPDWMQDWESIKSTARVWRDRNWYRTKRGAWRSVPALFLLLAYSPRGLGRLVARVSRYLYDYDSANARHEHAGKRETEEYLKLHRVRQANLHARWIVAGSVATLVAAPFLAYLSPLTLTTLTSVLLFVYIVKLIPGRGLFEVVFAFVVAVVAWFLARWGLTFLPDLPAWPFVVALVVIVLALGWVGRPDEPLMMADASSHETTVEKPSAPLVVEALIQISVGVTEKNQDQVRVYRPGVARAPRGYMLEMELPGGVTASAVMDKREEFAGALRRRIGTVWPSRGSNHPGHLKLFIADQPMTEAPQGKWAVANGQPLDVFSPIPLFDDQQGRWVEVTFAYNHFVVGGQPGFGKSVLVREFGVALAFDPRTMIVCLDGKGTGDLAPLRLVAYGFYQGDEEDEINEQLIAVRAIRQEMRRRNRFLRELSPDENPQNKVTSELVDKYPSLAPIVLLVDEVQVYTEHDDDKVKKEFIAIFTDLVKRGRAAGVIPVFCTQKPDAKALPSSIADNCTMRVCFRVHGWRSNDQILGSEMHSNGVKATLFAVSDKGIAYLRGDAEEAQIVRTVVGRKKHGLDQVEAEELCARARQIRIRRGTLSGYAAGEEAAQEEEQVDFLGDCRRAMGVAKAMLLPELLSNIATLSGHWAELDVKALGSMLKQAGVKRGTVWSPGLKRDGYGVKAEWLHVAATSDAEAGDDDDDGGSPLAVFA